jgi:hypothetical protein
LLSEADPLPETSDLAGIHAPFINMFINGCKYSPGLRVRRRGPGAGELAIAFMTAFMTAFGAQIRLVVVRGVTRGLGFSGHPSMITEHLPS